jgi:hypothetical protein
MYRAHKICTFMRAWSRFAIQPPPQELSLFPFCRLYLPKWVMTIPLGLWNFDFLFAYNDDARRALPACLACFVLAGEIHDDIDFVFYSGQTSTPRRRNMVSPFQIDCKWKRGTNPGEHIYKCVIVCWFGCSVRRASLFYDAPLCELCLCYANTFLHVAGKLIFAAADRMHALAQILFYFVGSAR